MTTAQQHKIHQPAERQLKIRSKLVARADNEWVDMPEISLCGAWLKSAGFEIGKTVIVRQELDQLVITLVQGKEDTPVKQNC